MCLFPSSNRNVRGFTLTELLGVVAVIAILAAIVISSVRGTLRASQESVLKGNLQRLNSAVQNYKSAGGVFYLTDPNDKYYNAEEVVSALQQPLPWLGSGSELGAVLTTPVDTFVITSDNWEDEDGGGYDLAYDEAEGFYYTPWSADSEDHREPGVLYESGKVSDGSRKRHPTPEPTPDPTPEPTPTPATTPTPIPEPTATPTPASTPDPFATPTPTPEPTASPTPTPEPTPWPNIGITRIQMSTLTDDPHYGGPTSRRLKITVSNAGNVPVQVTGLVENSVTGVFTPDTAAVNVTIPALSSLVVPVDFTLIASDLSASYLGTFTITLSGPINQVVRATSWNIN